MTPDKEEALIAHLKAIAQILYDESDPESMTTLEGIELSVRRQVQEHISPELGVFLSERLQERKRGSQEA